MWYIEVYKKDDLVGYLKNFSFRGQIFDITNNIKEAKLFDNKGNAYYEMYVLEMTETSKRDRYSYIVRDKE